MTASPRAAPSIRLNSSLTGNPSYSKGDEFAWVLSGIEAEEPAKRGTWAPGAVALGKVLKSW